MEAMRQAKSHTEGWVEEAMVSDGIPWEEAASEGKLLLLVPPVELVRVPMGILTRGIVEKTITEVWFWEGAMEEKIYTVYGTGV
jgi:hypothetical protein